MRVRIQPNYCTLHKRTKCRVGSCNGNSRLCEGDIEDIFWLIYDNVTTQKEIASIYEVHECTISEIKTMRKWKHVKYVSKS